MREISPRSPVAIVLIIVVVAYAGLLFIAPLVAILQGAFADGLEPVLAVFTDPRVQHAFQVTLILSLIATAINAVFGLIAALSPGIVGPEVGGVAEV